MVANILKPFYMHIYRQNGEGANDTRGPFPYMVIREKQLFDELDSDKNYELVLVIYW